MLKIPLVYEHLQYPNIWKPNASWNRKNEVHWNPHYKREIPWIIQQFINYCSIHYCDEVDSLDSFIYPVIMQEPYFQWAALSQPDHENFGFWSFIDKRVIECLKKGKGYVLIDCTMEPIRDSHMADILIALDRNTDFPNNRVIINCFSDTFIDHPNIQNLPSFLETTFSFMGSNYNNLFSTMEKKFHIHRPEQYKKVPYTKYKDFYSMHNECIHTNRYARSKNNYSTRKDLNPTYSLFNQRSEKHAGALLALCILDKADVLKNGVVSSNIEEFDVASTWKDIVNTQVVDTDWMRDFIFPSFKHEKYIENIFFDIAYYAKKVKFNLVIEAYYHSYICEWPLLTEKTWRNIGLEKPFIIIGQQNTLKTLHRLGYKTFHPYVNESYDLMHDDQRVLAAMKECIRLAKFTDDQWDKFYEDIQPILKHNKCNYFMRVEQTGDFLQKLIDNEY